MNPGPDVLAVGVAADGEWKDFTFKMLGKSDFPQVSKHLRENFYPDEPVSKIIGQSLEKFDEFDQAVCNSLDSGLCFAAIEKGTGKIRAVRTISRHSKNHGFSTFPFKSREMRLAVQFLTAVDNQCDIFKVYSVEEYADLRIASVDRQCRGQGLASEMYKRALSLLRGEGFQVVKSVFTSPHTRRAATNLGFQELARKYFREIQDEEGNPIRPNATDEEFAAVMALKL